MLNKPRGYVTTLDDPQKRPTVMQLMQQKSQARTVSRCGFTRSGGWIICLRACC